MINVVKEKNRLLVIHLDDCQEFFCGLTGNAKIIDGKIKVDEIMGFSLRNFSRKVYGLKKCRHILWVFSGTRQNLNMEFKIAGQFGDPFDVVKDLSDFDRETICDLGKYFQLDDISEVLKEQIDNLCGTLMIIFDKLKEKIDD